VTESVKKYNKTNKIECKKHIEVQPSEKRAKIAQTYLFDLKTLAEKQQSTK